MGHFLKAFQSFIPRNIRNSKRASLALEQIDLFQAFSVKSGLAVEQSKGSGLPGLMVACAAIAVSAIGHSPVLGISGRRSLS